MAGQLIPLDRPPPALRNRRSNLLAAAKAGVQGGFAVVGYKGRAWKLRYRGADTLLRDDRGAPMPNLEVVIVGVAEGISKQYYEKNYSEGDDSAPDCWSLDGVKPDAAVTRKQNDLCGNCRHNAWGSKITEGGKRAKACQDTRRLAIVPSGDIENESFGGPMMLRLPPMSLNNLANYADLLQRKDASFEVVATRLGFDYDVAYPRITFEAMGWLSESQVELVIGPDGNGGVCADPLIDRMLGAAVADPDEEEEEEAPKPAPKKRAAATPEPAPEEPGEAEEEAEEVEEDETQSEPPPPPPAAAPKNPFAAATAKAAPAAPAAPKRGRPRASATNGAAAQPQPAPSNMESAIHNLLDA
jgi:hypothetical protein